MKVKNNLSEYKNFFFLGIGGIGMSALARYFNHSGKKVIGYDKTPTPLTNRLIEEGVEVYFEDSTKIVDSNSKIINSKDTLVIFTPAIPLDSVLKDYFINNGFVLFKRSRVLGLITEETQCLAVAGTHGKTTTSTLLAHLCYESNQKVSAFLGGISENYHTNFLYNGNEVSVIEADEFDKSFLNLHPNIACITSTDADHLDIYGEEEHIKRTFQEFANLVPETGKLFIQKDIVIKGANVFTYSVSEKADYYVDNVQITGEQTLFDWVYPNGKIQNLVLNIPGRHNLENTIVALAMAFELGVNESELRKALASFKGIKRRFNIYKLNPHKVYVDDYAHHPTEINAALQTVNLLYPNKKVLTIFQPHLFSRTRDFMDDFAKSLEKTDELIVLDIYPARELPIEGVDSQVLLNKINLKNKQVCSLSEVMSQIEKIDFDIIVTLGAGNIDTLIDKIKEIS